MKALNLIRFFMGLPILLLGLGVFSLGMLILPLKDREYLTKQITEKMLNS